MSNSSSYIRVEGRRWGHVFRGFRVSRRRFSIQTTARMIKNRVVRLLKLIGKWKSPYVGKGGGYAGAGGNKRRGRLIVPTGAVVFHDCRLRSLARTNSFYSEAIADCLDFIKRSSSVSMEDCRSVTAGDQ